MRFLNACLGLFAFAGAAANTFAACDASVQLESVDNRFEAIAAGIVRDSKTGLNWQRCSLGQSWSDAASSCTGEATQYTWFEAMQIATNDGWRVPNKKELVSIVVYDCSAPAWSEAAFGAQNTGVFWSATPLPYFGSPTAWAIDFADGAFTQTSASNTYAVRLVKGGD